MKNSPFKTTGSCSTTNKIRCFSAESYDEHGPFALPYHQLMRSERTRLALFSHCLKKNIPLTLQQTERWLTKNVMRITLKALDMISSIEYAITFRTESCTGHSTTSTEIKFNISKSTRQATIHLQKRSF